MTVIGATPTYSNTGEGGYGYLWKTFPRAESMPVYKLFDLLVAAKIDSVFDNLYPESDLQFFYVSWDRKIEFAKDEDGYVTHYFLIIKGVKQKAIRIK